MQTACITLHCIVLILLPLVTLLSYATYTFAEYYFPTAWEDPHLLGNKHNVFVFLLNKFTFHCCFLFITTNKCNCGLYFRVLYTDSHPKFGTADTTDDSASTPPDSKSPPSSVASWAQSNGVGVFGAGLSEAMPLHVTCHSASDGTKLESTGGRHHASVVSSMPGALGAADPNQVSFQMTRYAVFSASF